MISTETRPLYHFQVLPLHPKPKPLESYTGYLTRLGEHNGIRVMNDLANLLFPEQSPTLTRKAHDLPPMYIGILPRMAQRSESDVLATTFWHVADKFGRYPEPRTMSKFLYRTVASSFRYCPRCLAEDEEPYYRLTWRFSLLEGCPAHGCRLLDACPSCGRSQPFLSSPLRIGRCTSCSTDLRSGQAEILSDPERERVRNRSADLEFLLTPRADAPGTFYPMPGPNYRLEERQAIAVDIGKRLNTLRRARRWTSPTLAANAVVTTTTVFAIERGTVQQWGAFFIRYVTIAEALGVPLRAVLDETCFREQLRALPNPDEFDPYQSVKQPRPEESAAYVAAMGERINEAMEGLRREGAPLTRQNVAERVGVRWWRLLRYPTLRPLLADVELLRKKVVRWRTDEELIGEIDQAIEAIRAEGKLITRIDVSYMVGMSLVGLRRHPRVKAHLEAEIPLDANAVKARSEQRENELLAKIAEIKAQLSSEGQPVTLKAIYSLVGVSRTKLMYYPQVREALVDIPPAPLGYTEEQYQERAAELLERVQMAIEELEAAGKPVTQDAVRKAVGMSAPALREYPQIREILLAIVQKGGLRGRRKFKSWELPGQVSTEDGPSSLGSD